MYYTKYIIGYEQWIVNREKVIYVKIQGVIYVEEISIQELFFILRKRVVLILVMLMISITIAGVLSYYVIKPEYQTFTTLMIGKPKDYQGDRGIEYNDLILNQRLVSTYGQIVKMRVVADKVINNLGLGISYGEFGNKVSVNLVKDTEIIKLQVTDYNPTLATNIANETAKVFMESVKDIMLVENVQVIDEAQIPKSPIKPKPMLNIAIAGVLGIMGGVFLAFLLEFLDNTIKTSEDIEKHLGLSVLGTIPIFEKEKDKMITVYEPKSPIAESFRTLRTNIQFANIDKEIKVILVTSAAPGEGKSTVMSNLGNIMTQSDKKTLLMDCDFRKPTLHRRLNLSNIEGLTNVLMADKPLSEVVQVSEEIENLSILTSGPVPPNPAELLGSERMKKFLEVIRNEYDMIIIDTPPVGLVTDAAVLSTRVDGVLLTVAAEQTDIESIKRGKKSLKRVNANILGVVLNKVPLNSRTYYKYGYYHYSDETN